MKNFKITIYDVSLLGPSRAIIRATLNLNLGDFHYCTPAWENTRTYIFTFPYRASVNGFLRELKNSGVTKKYATQVVRIT